MNPWIAIVFTLSFIIVFHEWGHFIVARLIGVKVERFSIGFGPRLLKIQRGDTEYSISLFPIGGYVKMAGESEEEGPKKPWEYRSRKVWERMAIVLAGPVMNYAVGFLLFAVIFMVGAPVVSLSDTARIGEVIPGYPAEAAGLQPGDTILTINGKEVSTWEEVTGIIHRETAEVELLLEREGQRFSKTVQPRLQEIRDERGDRVRVGMIGISPVQNVEIVRYPVHQAVYLAGEKVWVLTVMTMEALWRMMTGGLSFKESLTGPVGIFRLTATVAERGIVPLLQLIAILSTSLGFFNLLPVPVLDGGHFAFLFIEKIKGSPLSIRTQEMMVRMGLGLLLLLLVVVTYNDLVRFGIWNRIFPFFHSN
ncbi:MAG: RIP metalloprotease RseP [Candidatus Omnitrophica bacterium]|nr:RIP metalloprotease RseP [Candidatus Omnitrophota bacterium]